MLDMEGARRRTARLVVWVVRDRVALSLENVCVGACVLVGRQLIAIGR